MNFKPLLFTALLALLLTACAPQQSVDLPSPETQPQNQSEQQSPSDSDTDPIIRDAEKVDDDTLTPDSPMIYPENHDQQRLDYTGRDLSDGVEVTEVMDYAAYAAYCEKYGFDRAYDDESKTYLVHIVSIDGYPNAELMFDGMSRDDSDLVTFYFHEANIEPGEGCPVIMTVVPTASPCTGLTVDYRLFADTAPEETWVISQEIAEATYAKPILYLYPREETALTVTVGDPSALTCAYPLYQDGWHVTARPDGTLTDGTREYYALYWEGRGEPVLHDDGFVVAREDLIPFLEEKLSLLGLTDREAEEMIVYWLPILQESPYQFLRFADPAELLPLEFSVEPDTLIRVMLQFKPLQQPMEVREQRLTSPTRTGFVAVEWGGCQLP